MVILILFNNIWLSFLALKLHFYVLRNPEAKTHSNLN